MTDDQRDGGGDGRDPAAHDWQVVESVTEYETGWYTGGYDLVEQPDGSTKRYYWAALPAAVVLVAVVADPGEYGLDGEARSLVMVEQYRPTIRRLCRELPAGIVEADESFTDAGARELAEETGLRPASTELLASYWCATGVLRHRRGIVWASDFEAVPRRLDGNEFLTVRPVPVDEALDVALGPAANDATIEGVLLAAERGLL